MSNQTQRYDFRVWGLVCVLLSGGCSSESSSPNDPRQELLRSWWEGFHLPELVELEEHAVELEIATSAYCVSPTPQSLEAARAAWRRTHRSLKRQEVFAFGPYTEEPLRYQARIDFWPARPETIEDVIVSRAAWTQDDIVGLGAAARGLPAAEYILWSGEPGEARRCSYLNAVVVDISSNVGGLREAWDPETGGHWSHLISPGEGGEYASTLLAISEVVNRLWFTIENIRRTKLGKPLGDDAGGTPQPDVVEARFSPRAVGSIRDNLDAVETLYFGTEDVLGPAIYVEEQRPALNEEIRMHLAEAREALGAIDGPLTQAVVDDREDVQEAVNALGRLQTAIEVDVISTLGLSLSFNDNDGD